MKEIYLIILIVVINVVMTTAVSVQPSQALMVSYWDFDEGSGITAFDSIDSNPGTLVNGTAWTTGMHGNAVSFDGVNDYIEVSQSSNLSITNAITLEAWVNPTAFLSPWANTVIMKAVPGTWYGDYELGYYGGASPGSKWFVRLNRNAITFHSNSDVQLNEWTHVVATYDRSFIKMYINGELDSLISYSQPLMTSGGNLRFGATDVITPNQMRGVIDEVAIYDVALTEEEVLSRLAIAVHPGDVAPVPEPGTMLLLGSGLAGLAAFRRKFKK
jgi:hypothetical protein